MAKDEVISLVKCKNYDLVDNLLIVDINSSAPELLSKRLGYTKKIFRLLFSCPVDKLVLNLSDYNWETVYKKNFSVRIEGKAEYTEKGIAGYVWEGVQRPKVKLVDAKTVIFVFFVEGKVFCCLLEREINHDFSKRKAHKRPELHPSSLDPKLARVLVNLTGILKGEVVDPFCGSGGFLIEAGLMGLDITGYDIDQIMINRSRINLEYYDVKDYKLINKDALKLNRKMNYIVSDLPYGKNTKQNDLRALYSGFLLNLKGLLVKRGVVCFPVFGKKKNINYPELIKKNGFKIINKYEYYLHASLSKRIFVIERK